MTPAVAAELEFRIELERRIEAPIEDVWDAMLVEVGPAFGGEDGSSLKLKIEPFPGGRWYRDFGDDSGHFWAHVQAIRPPTLFELAGPLFMSFPVSNNLQYRLSYDDGVTTLRFVHHAFGPMPDEMREEMPKGWTDHIDGIEGRLTG